MQTTSHILMIRPVNFGYNAETAVNNAFQVNTAENDVQQKARSEFDGFVQILLANGIDITVVDDTPNPYTPDSIFPNNWISFHHDGTILYYPMYAENRRSERKSHVVDQIRQHFLIRNEIDLSSFEDTNQFLEGTGSMVLDRDNKIAYACLSPRTDEKVLKEFCKQMSYTPVVFNATDGNSQPIYHTNVMMCIADRFVVICLESITIPEQQQLVRDTINKSGKALIPISLKQMNHFAGNMLQVENNKGEKLLIMSSQAFESLNPEQIQALQPFNRIVHASLNTIETNGGGSARCMMAEIHLPPK